MRIASFRVGDRSSFGLIRGETIIDLGNHESAFSGVRQALAAGTLLELVSRADERSIWSMEDVTLLPAVPDPSAIYCVGLNYKAHAAEAGKETEKGFPVLFFRMAGSIVGHDAPLHYPHPSEKYDYEGELAVIIGKGGRDIPVEQAMEHVVGYSCFLDGSARDFQRISLDAGKNFDASGALGPWLVTTDEIPDPSALTLSTYVNGGRVQHSGVDQLIHSIPELISQFSTIRGLAPGDVIATGTPAGVGNAQTPPRYLVPGDEVIVEVSKIGRLRNTVSASHHTQL